MSNRNRAAIDIKQLIGNAELVAAVDNLTGEGFIEFPQADVVDFEPVAFEQLGNREYRSDSHLVRLASCYRHPAINSQRVQSALLGLFALHQDAGRDPVRELARVAGGDKSARPLHRWKGSESVQSGAGAIAFVALERYLLLCGLASFFIVKLFGNGGRDDFVVEAAGFLRGEGALLTLERV